MINAGATILGYDGQQNFEPETKQWSSILLQVFYPEDQNFTNNPVSSGDVLIEPNGNSWRVKLVNVVSNISNKFRVHLEQLTLLKRQKQLRQI